MSDEAPSIVVASPGDRDHEALTPEYHAAEDALSELADDGAPECLPQEAIEAILGDFRAWLSETPVVIDAAPAPMMDLATVVQHFTSLRQEVNLQTRSSRTVQEQGAQTLELLRQAQEELLEQKGDEKEDEKAEAELLRPLLKTLVDAHDALALALRQVKRKLDQTPVPDSTPPAPRVELYLPAWARWLGLRSFFEQKLPPAGAPQQVMAQDFRPILDTLLVGYEMSLQRLDRAMDAQGLETIPCAGAPFDPELMEVVEVVRDPERSATEVIEEVRRGYLWHGRLFRFAQVRVAKP